MYKIIKNYYKNKKNKNKKKSLIISDYYLYKNYDNNVFFNKTYNYIINKKIYNRISYYKNGNKHYKTLIKNGVIHRKGDLPAEIKYYKNGKIASESYVRNGFFHRNNRSCLAKITYHKNGNKKSKSKYGYIIPFRINYDKYGKIIK